MMGGGMGAGMGGMMGGNMGPGWGPEPMMPGMDTVLAGHGLCAGRAGLSTALVHMDATSSYTEAALTLA